MKKLRIVLTTLMTAVVVAISTGVYAYSGQNVDAKYEITMPDSLTNGVGTVSNVSGEMKYQFVEISQAKYATIKKYDAQVQLIRAYKVAEAKGWVENSTESNLYKSLVTKYESTYNEKVSDLYSKYKTDGTINGFDDDAIATVRALWIHELPDPVEANWKTATNNKISIDLTTFTGTKYYVAWVKTGDVLDAEAYIVKGTKSENKEQPKDENKKTPTDNTIKTPTNGTTPTTTKSTTTATNAKALPKTGIGSTVLGLIAVAGTSAGISYRKYRKIK